MPLKAMRRPLLALACLSFVLPSFDWTAAASRGIRGQSAPPWEVAEWHQLPDGAEDLEVNDFRGKVLYMFCFQSWCPGCHSHGFPALQKVSDHFADDERVGFVVFQTVFEGFSSNTLDRGLETLQEYGLDQVPFAHDQGPGGHASSPIMSKYRTGGTPWTVIVGPDGKVLFDGFSIDPDQAIAFIEGLLEKVAAKAQATS